MILTSIDTTTINAGSTRSSEMALIQSSVVLGLYISWSILSFYCDFIYSDMDLSQALWKRDYRPANGL